MLVRVKSLPALAEGRTDLTFGPCNKVADDGA